MVSTMEASEKLLDRFGVVPSQVGMGSQGRPDSAILVEDVVRGVWVSIKSLSVTRAAPTDVAGWATCSGTQKADPQAGFRRGWPRNTEGELDRNLSWSGVETAAVPQDRPLVQGSWLQRPSQYWGGTNRHRTAGGSTFACLSVLVQIA